MPPMSCRISSSCSASVSARSELPVYARMTAYMRAASFHVVYPESIGVSHDRAPMSRRKPQGLEVVLEQRHEHLRLRQCAGMSPELAARQGASPDRPADRHGRRSDGL